MQRDRSGQEILNIGGIPRDIASEAVWRQESSDDMKPF
jgi:hypothetical protein